MASNILQMIFCFFNFRAQSLTYDKIENEIEKGHNYYRRHNHGSVLEEY